MPTLVIDDVPTALFNRIHALAKAQRQTPAAAALEVLEDAFRTSRPTLAEAPLPRAPFLTQEICAPCSIPWPEGEPVVPIDVADYLPRPHDIPDSRRH